MRFRGASVAGAPFFAEREAGGVRFGLVAAFFKNNEKETILYFLFCPPSIRLTAS